MCETKKKKENEREYNVTTLSDWKLSHSVEKFKHSETQGLKLT